MVLSSSTMEAGPVLAKYSFRPSKEADVSPRDRLKSKFAVSRCEI